MEHSDIQPAISPLRCETSIFTLKVWPMGVTSTVSRLPITVKVVPVASSEEEGHREQQQQGEPEEERSQQQSCQTQGEEEAARTGDVCVYTTLIHPDIRAVIDNYIVDCA